MNTYTTSGQSLPSVAPDSLGNFVIVWGSWYQDGSGYGIFAQRYSRIAPGPLHFYTVPPCRVVDTRDPDGTFGGPALGALGLRTFPIALQCSIPADALAVSANVAVVSPAAAGFLTLYAAGTPQPATSTINFAAGQTRANNVVVSLEGSPAGAVAVSNAAPGTVNVLIDVNGYFK